MRMIALAGVALALSACGGGNNDSANDANALATDNMLIDENLLLDANSSMNGATGMDANGMDANASVNASTENLMMKDKATHDPDTNLANGL
jgi:hypothetical protein